MPAGPPYGNRNAFIYALLDPRDNKIKYIGKSKDPKTRFRKHLTQKGNTFKHKWISFLLDNSMTPILNIIEKCSESIIDEREKYWIAKYKNQICNHTAGGEGGATFTGKKHKQETKQKIGVANTGNKREDLSLFNRTSKSKKVIQIDPNTGIELAVFNSVVYASKITGCSKTNISKFASGNIKPSIKKVGGYHWRYAV